MDVADRNAEGAARRGIAFMLVGVSLISVNDMLIKALSGGYPLHELIFFRSAVGVIAMAVLVWRDGGWRVLHTATPGLHALRASLVVVANMTFFAALAVLPLATATALFFIAPLCITLMSAVLLGERVGPRRLGAVALGFAGVLVILRPWGAWEGDVPPRLSLALPVFAAVCYAGMQVLTRKLGAASRASALSLFIQSAFLGTSLLFFLFAGHGRFAEGLESESLLFLLRAWVWPAPGDWGPIAILGVSSAGIGYCMSQAYRLGDAATIAPFEYALMPLAIFWGVALFGEVPGPWVLLGSVLIVGAGLYVFARERRLGP